MLHQLESTGMIDQGITGNACLRVVRTREAAINHQHLPIGLDRILTLHGAYRHMAVDDMAMSSLHTKLIQDLITNLLLRPQRIVGTLLLLVRLRIGNEETLERSHLALIEQRGIRTTPEIPDIIASESQLLRLSRLEIGLTHQLIHLI